MKVSWIKYKDDKKSFKIPELFGFDVFSIQDMDEIDVKIDELIAKNYNTFIISNELAGFSEKINNEYLNNKNIEIIISRDNKYKRS